MSNAMNNESDWIPLMDYAMKNGVSLSTLRRHIKANKVPYKIENGRYLLRSNEPVTMERETAPMVESKPIPARFAPTAVSAAPSSASSEAMELKRRLHQAQEEIAELKMLVALYEEQLAQPKSPQAGSHLSRSGHLGFNG
jgi:hypothetical protein